MVVTTGFFDGVHLGHRKVIETLVQIANQRGTESVVVTFWPHPRTVLQDGARELRLLSTLEEKKERLLSYGVDRVEVVDFTREFSQLSTIDYLKDYLVGKLGAEAIVLGYDNRIGSDTLSVAETEKCARELGMEVVKPIPVSSLDGPEISSTRIRTALNSGEVENASAMLGYDYSLHGVVVPGNRIGRTLGFPTANIQLYYPLKLVPGNGVYLTGVETLGRKYFGMTNIGLRPTLTRDTVPVIETNIFDFEEDIYGLDIKIQFMRKLRDEIEFNSVDLLKYQLTLDSALCKEMINQP